VSTVNHSNVTNIYNMKNREDPTNPLQQGWVTCGPQAKCGPHERLKRPSSQFSLPNLEYKITSKRS